VGEINLKVDTSNSIYEIDLKNERINDFFMTGGLNFSGVEKTTDHYQDKDLNTDL